MPLEGSSKWTQAALLLGASVIAGCGSRSELMDKSHLNFVHEIYNDEWLNSSIITFKSAL